MSDKWEAVKQANGDWHALRPGHHPVVFEAGQWEGGFSTEMLARNEAARRNGEPVPFRGDILEPPFGGHIDPPPGCGSGILIVINSSRLLRSWMGWWTASRTLDGGPLQASCSLTSSAL